MILLKSQTLKGYLKISEAGAIEISNKTAEAKKFDSIKDALIFANERKLIYLQPIEIKTTEAKTKTKTKTKKK